MNPSEYKLSDFTDRTFRLGGLAQAMFGDAWYNVTIKELDQDAFPGEESIKVPVYKIHYVGWNKRYDEWVFGDALRRADELGHGQSSTESTTTSSKKKSANNRKLPSDNPAVVPAEITTVSELITAEILSGTHEHTTVVFDLPDVSAGSEGRYPLQQNEGETAKPSVEKPKQIRKPKMEKKRKKWVRDNFEWSATTDMSSNEIVRMFERWCKSEGLSVREDHGLKDPMNSISKLMEKEIRGTKGRNNGKSKGGYQRRKPNCGFTTAGEKLYRELFPEYDDLKMIVRNVPKRKPRRLENDSHNLGSSESDSE